MALQFVSQGAPLQEVLHMFCFSLRDSHSPFLSLSLHSSSVALSFSLSHTSFLFFSEFFIPLFFFLQWGDPSSRECHCQESYKNCIHRNTQSNTHTLTQHVLSKQCSLAESGGVIWVGVKGQHRKCQQERELEGLEGQREREREWEKEREFEQPYNKKKSFPAATAAEQAKLVSLAPLFTLRVLFGCMILDGANRVSNTTSLFLFLQT